MPYHHASSGINSIAITPNGQYAISSSKEQPLTVWEMASGTRVRTMGDRGEVRGNVVALPNNKQVISASNLLKVWDIETGVELYTLNEDQTGFSDRVAITPDGSWAISSPGFTGSEYLIYIWNLSERKKIKTLKGQGQGLTHVRKAFDLIVSLDGRHLIFAHPDIGVRFWNIKDIFDEVLTMGMYPTNTIITQDSRYFIFGSFVGTITIIEAKYLRETDLFGPHDYISQFINRMNHPGSAVFGPLPLQNKDYSSLPINHTRDLAPMPDGKHFVSVSFDKILRIWSIENGEIIAQFQGEHEFTACAVSPNGRTVVTGDASGKLHFLRLEGVNLGVPVVTAFRTEKMQGIVFRSKQDKLHVMCPFCFVDLGLPNQALGNLCQCPHCSEIFMLNPFTIDI